jgi:hypothetical protein
MDRWRDRMMERQRYGDKETGRWRIREIKIEIWVIERQSQGDGKIDML